MGHEPKDTLSDAVFGVEMSASGRRWLRHPFVARHAALISAENDIPLVVGEILSARGISPEAAPAFLNPSLKADMADPSVMRDMDRAADRIADAILGGETTAIFGDYDVDGATSTALLMRYLKALGCNPLYHIPDRIKEGYGPNIWALEQLKGRGARLVITVDCGTLSFEPLAAAEAMGLDVIVLDHHKAEPVLPTCYALVNPNRLDDDSGLGQLAAVGVTFFLLVALQRSLRARKFFEGRAAPDLLQLLDLVALGTVCDVVPLRGINRTFVRQGLHVLRQRESVGLKALADAGRVQEAPSTYHLGFVLGPRINAGGRVGESDLGVRLLTSEDEGVAEEIAARLDDYNRERQDIERAVLEDATAGVERDRAIRPNASILFASGEGWHPGVIGIVASRLKEKFGLPSVVVAVDGAEAKGSARSISGVDLGAAVIEAAQQGYITQGGGHAMAAGLSAPAQGLEKLREFLEEQLAPSVTQARDASNTVHLDGVISPSAVTGEFADKLDLAGPFGAGNPTPRFAVGDVTLAHVDIVGKDHVRCRFKGRDGANFKAMAFRAADQALGKALLEGYGRRFHVAGQLKRDTWAGGNRAEITLHDAADAS